MNNTEGFAMPMARLAMVMFLVAAWLVRTTAAADDAGPAGTRPDKPRLTVAVMPIAAAVSWTGDRPSGVMIDIWDELAGRLGVATEFVRMPTFVAVLDAMQNGRTDVGLGPIAITEAREKTMDFTHPITHSGLRIAVRQREDTGFLAAFKSLVSWKLLQLLGAAVALAIASGHLLWWWERRVNPQSFPEEYPRGVGEAIWWISSVIITGGCDDKHVDSVPGRAIAFAWMVGGIVLVAAFTSLLTATLTAERVTGAIHGPRDLFGCAVGCQQAAVSVQSVRQRGGIPQEFPTMNDAMDALAMGLVEAVVGENQQLMQLVQQPGRDSLRLVGPMFDTFDYGIGLPTGSPLRENLNAAILRMREDGAIARIMERWLGQHD
jgi:ABC-type amino acid transport substrate-binding protein